MQLGLIIIPDNPEDIKSLVDIHGHHEPAQKPLQERVEAAREPQYTEPTKEGSPCPKCSEGNLRIIKRGTNKSGPWYVYGCDKWQRDGSGCDFTKPSWQE